MSKNNPQLNRIFDRSSQLRTNNIKQQLAKAIELNESLKQQLETTQGAVSVELHKINPNPHQPRQSFYVVEEKIESMKQLGQITPIVLTRLPNNKIIIFDGECRYRAAMHLKWQTMKAVFINYQPELFDEQVLAGAIADCGLNNLDLAAALATRISQVVPKLDSDGVVRICNTIVKRLKRSGNINLFKGLNKKKQQQQQEAIAAAKLDEQERLVIETILAYQLNPITVGLVTLPFLRLPEDIKAQIRDRGLSDSNAKIIGTVRQENNRLKITKNKALKIRQKLCELALTNHWTNTQTRKAVAEAVASYLIKKDTQVKNLEKSIAAIEQINLKQYSQAELERLKQVLMQKLEEIRNKK